MASDDRLQHALSNTSLTPIPPAPTKVVLDKALSLVLLVASSPLSLAIASAILIEGLVRPSSRGSVIHSEVRISAGHPFTLYKFRILTPAGEAAIRAGAIPKKVENNPSNLTAVGRALKKIGLDELPQLVNVLGGAMSLVGPRPKPPPEYREALAQGNVFHAQLRAGLSGPSQVLKGTVRTTEDARRAEFAYVDLMREGSQWQILVYDVKMHLKTARVLFRMTGE